ncbi:hypothetical protein BCR44DRAFT_1260556 [Catenaria anguillulae PL171]|uniref:Basic membrane protein-domain-containing protein n=1 Tax=Catenaria anguillulae PL171 TaxID=765915 RepID=A0A1Y2HCX7_9FUNG|nr:hypothetical protein BCR44DRAFT_1260556 [Catenaria anguillulae PL171]
MPFPHHVTATANDNPFIAEAIRGCQEASQAAAASGASAIQCRSAVIDGFIAASAMQAQWDALVTGNDDEVFIGLSFTYADVAAYLGPKYPSKVFAVVDSTVDVTASKNTIGVVFAEDQAGYLAGALAGVFTSSRKVGVIGGVPIPPVKRFVNGYLSGVLSLCPTCEVYNTYFPSFANVTGGQLSADGLLANGADVIFGAGGLTGSSGILRAAAQGAWAIGVDSDESRTTFLNRPEAPKLLSSALKRSDTAVKTVIESVKKGQRGGFNLALDASLDGVGLADLVTTAQRNFSTEVTVSLRASGDACATTTYSPRSTILNLIRSSLQRKLLTTGVFAGSGDLQPLAAPANKTWYDMAPYGERSQVLPNMQGHGAVVLAQTNKILVWGGQNQFAEFPQHVMVLDFDRFAWQKMPTNGVTVPSGRMFHAMAHDAQANAVWVFGGQTQIVNGNLAAAVLGDTWKLDVATRTWTQVTTSTSPSARTNVAHAQVGRAMWVYGGTTAAGIVQSDLWRFDMAAGTWAAMSATGDVPPALQHATMAAINSTHVLMYGGAQATALSNVLYILDTAALKWKVHKPSTLSSGGSGPPPAERVRAITVDDRRVLFTGGLSAQGALNSTWVWRMDEDRWDPNGYGSLPGQLHSHALVSFNQSATPGACTYTVDATTMTICTAQKVPAVVAISGVTNRPGGGVAVSFANPDPPPPPMGTVDAGVKWAVTVINIVGILLALGLVAFVLVNRGNKVVKAANPPFCLIILAGAILAHVGLIGSGWDMDGRSGMMQTAFLLGGGYTLMFSGLVTKIYLVYSIFSSKRIMKRKMAPYYLFAVLAFGVQMLLSGLWFVLDATPSCR